MSLIDSPKSWAEENLPIPETLEQAIRERNNWCEAAAQHLRNEQYYRGLVVKIGEMLGSEAYISDDGSVQDSVLCAKVPELVTKLSDSLDIRCRNGCTLKKINQNLRRS